MARERERLWQQHITEWQTSGMAYCKQRSLTYCWFVYRRKKLAGVASDGPAPSGFARAASERGVDRFIKNVARVLPRFSGDYTVVGSINYLVN